MDTLQKQIEAYIDGKRDEMINALRELVSLEGTWSEPEELKAVADYVKALFEKSGVSCELITANESTPPVVYGVIGENRKGQPIILSGHYDTVFKKGFLEQHPFRIDEQGHAYGPGVLDMKGGIIISAYIIRALEAVGYQDRPIRICFCGDEEAGPNHSHAAEVIRESAKGCIAAFNMETGRPDNAICTGRKGAAGSSFVVHGKAAHSGNAFEAGRNAVVEAAYKIVALNALTNMETGTHMNVAMVKGGQMPNQIPDRCEVVWMCRFKAADEMEKTLKAVDEIIHTSHVEGTTAEAGGMLGSPVFEENEKNLALCEFINRISEADGYSPVSNFISGGASDAPNLQFHGAVTLCSCGICGEWNHTEREYAIVESLYTRTKLWCDVIRHINEFKF